MEQALVSVIVPVYRTERYLKKCVDSILSQTYANLELLLIDDGSPDGCPALCDVLAEGDARIRVFHKANGGLSSARNYGLNQMVGDYVTFVDSDDYLDSNFITCLIQILEFYHADVAFAALQYVPGPRIGLEDGVYSTEQCMERMLYRNGMGDFSCAKLYRCEMFRSVRFTEGITSEDFELFYRLFRQTSRVSTSNSTSYYYIQQPKSITNSGFSSRMFNRLDICERLIEDIQNDDPTLLPAAQARAVDESIWLYGITPKHYTEQRSRMRAIVKRYAKSVWNDPNVTSRIKRRIFVFSISPLLWTLRMRLKALLIRVYAKVRG